MEPVPATHHDDPNPAQTALIVAIFTLLTVATLLGLQAYFGREQEREFEVKVVERSPAALEAVMLAHRVDLASYRWIDRERDVVAIPIDRAIELVVDEMAAGQPGATPPAPPVAPESPEASEASNPNASNVTPESREAH